MAVDFRRGREVGWVHDNNLEVVAWVGGWMGKVG